MPKALLEVITIGALEGEIWCAGGGFCRGGFKISQFFAPLFSKKWIR